MARTRSMTSIDAEISKVENELSKLQEKQDALPNFPLRVLFAKRVDTDRAFPAGSDNGGVTVIAVSCVAVAKRFQI